VSRKPRKKEESVQETRGKGGETGAVRISRAKALNGHGESRMKPEKEKRESVNKSERGRDGKDEEKREGKREDRGEAAI